MLQNRHPYPKSFPTESETRFLHVLLCSDKDFPEEYSAWKKDVVFDDIDYAMNRMLPLMYIRLQSLGISDELEGRIKGVYRMTWANNQRIIAATKELATLLENNGIKVMVLKGLPVLMTVYKNAGARFLGDADLLIYPEDAKKAVDLILASNYRFLNPKSKRFVTFTNKHLNKIAKEATFVSRNGIEIDLHWSILRRRSNDSIVGIVPTEDLFNRSHTVSFEGYQYRFPSAEDLLMHIMVHGAPHNPYRGFRWVGGATWIIRNLPVDWALFMSLVRKYEFEVEIAMAFSYLLEEKFIELPLSVVAQLDALTISKQKLEEYYQEANGVRQYRLLGNLPMLWEEYWLYEVTGTFPGNVIGFFDYCAQSWGLAGKWQIPGFILKKYVQRLKYYFSAHSSKK